MTSTTSPARLAPFGRVPAPALPTATARAAHRPLLSRTRGLAAAAGALSTPVLVGKLHV